MLCHVMMWHVMLCFAKMHTVCCVVLCHGLLWYAMFEHDVLCYAMLWFVLLCSDML